MREYFDGPLEVLRWGRDEIEKFCVSAQAFVDGYKPELYSEVDFAAGETAHGYIVREEPPDELRRLGYYVVTNLRNALDQAMHAASLRLGTTREKKTNFPAAESPDNLARQLERNSTYKGIPTELYPVINSFHPYWEAPEHPDGDTILRSLLDVANPNKHRSPVKIALLPHGVGIRAMIAVKSFQVKRVDENKMELFRTVAGHPFKFDADIEITVAFDGGRWIDGKAAGVVFNLMADKVEGIITELRDETDRILLAKGQDAAHG